MKKTANDSSFVINRSTGISIGVISLLLSPLIASIIFISVTNEKIKSMSSELDQIKSNSYNNKISLKSYVDKEISEQNISLSILRDEYKEQIDYIKKTNNNFLTRINELSYNIKYMEGMFAEYKERRWTKEQDSEYMSIFASQNKLILPKHE